MAAADTNVLVRLLVADDAPQLARAKKALLQHGPLFISQLALLETVWVLSRAYEIERADIAEIIEQMLRGSDFLLQRPAEIAAALLAFRRSRAELSDCLLLENARAEGQLPLLTFDKALAKLSDAKAI